MYVHMMIVEVDQEPYIVEMQSCGISPEPGDMVEFDIGDGVTRAHMIGPVMHTAYMQVGDEDYTMIQMLHDIQQATKLWSFSWAKEPDKEEALEDES